MRKSQMPSVVTVTPGTASNLWLLTPWFPQKEVCGKKSETKLIHTKHWLACKANLPAVGKDGFTTTVALGRNSVNV